MDWQLIITIGSILTALGVIIGFASKWGGVISKGIAKNGWKKLSAKELEENEAWRKHEEFSKEMMKALIGLGDKLDTIHNDLSSNLNENTKLTLKLELKDLFKNHPERLDAIENAYDEYRQLHGNSYIEELHEEWKSNYLKDRAKKEVNKRSK